MDKSITKKQVTTLALLGFLILALFAVGLVWLRSYSGVFWSKDEDIFLAFAPYWVFRAAYFQAEKGRGVECRLRENKNE